MTWSIIARDEPTGRIGIIVVTKFFAVGAMVPHIKTGVGAIASQAFINPHYGPQGLALLEARLGAEATVPWEHITQAWRLLEKLKKQKVHLYALEQHPKSKQLFNLKPKFPCALIVGHELKGVSKTILKYTDAILEIPMHGTKESLNVAVATGIAVYYLHGTRNSTRHSSSRINDG